MSDSGNIPLKASSGVDYLKGVEAERLASERSREMIDAAVNIALAGEKERTRAATDTANLRADLAENNVSKTLALIADSIDKNDKNIKLYIIKILKLLLCRTSV